MRAPRLAGAALVAAAIAVVVLIVGGGSDPYRLQLQLDNAAGLRDGSDVVSGGVKVGEVKLHLGRGDQVIADLDIDRARAPVGRDVRAAISAVNFLGRKRVEITAGNVRDAAPSGFVVPRSRVTTSTDLDQVVNVLDADTRTRLSILINEAGAAFSGRRADFNQLLGTLPHSLVKANALLSQLVSDNHTLGDTVTSSDRVLARVSGERRSLSRLVGVLGQTAAPLAQKRAALRATLARAPGTLRTLQRFLGDLKATTAPLGPAARDISATAPALTATLDQVDPFRQAADPALKTATKAAPTLTRLAAGATPVVKQAAPVVAQVADVSKALVPVSDTLDHSVDNVLAIVQNWSRAIQFRDGLSHVFRGEALVSPETVRSLVERLGIKLDGLTKKKDSKGAKPKAPANPLKALQPAPAAKQPVPKPAPLLPQVGASVDKTVQGVKKLVDGVLNGSTNKDKPAGVNGLLDYLLGGGK
jgi:virulence factor Mce-like protein